AQLISDDIGSRINTNLHESTRTRFVKIGVDSCKFVIRLFRRTKLMAEQQFLAFDLGAESGRAMLGALADGKLSLEEKHRFANPMGRMNGHLFWNLLAQGEELKTGWNKTSAR